MTNESGLRYKDGRLDFTHGPSLGAFIGKSLASFVSGNRMPVMSGDDRERIPDHIRSRYDHACESVAAEVLALISPAGEVVVPVEPTREQQLAMDKALLDNWPKLIGGDVCVNGRLTDAVYAAALSAAPRGMEG